MRGVFARGSSKGLAVLAAAGLLALSACSSEGGKKSEETPEGAGPRLKIAMVTHSGAGDTFWDIVQKGAKAAAAKDNVEFLYSADPDGGKQAQLVQAAIDQKVDGIIVTLAKPEAMKDVLARATAAKIPVVSINSGAAESAKLGAIAHFGQDESIAGEAAAPSWRRSARRRRSASSTSRATSAWRTAAPARRRRSAATCRTSSCRAPTCRR
ncbi:substrate-binding domain-containing protein [Actinomadura madurae]|uniref:substrate-binding domain-containing protein n=1 Tax=Actinomadura madurae TaxID=1993 RepID=UPI0020D2406B|nr:substrate-binding domain-containing protein [Actinomadura madurae]